MEVILFYFFIQRLLTYYMWHTNKQSDLGCLKSAITTIVQVHCMSHCFINSWLNLCQTDINFEPCQMMR